MSCGNWTSLVPIDDDKAMDLLKKLVNATDVEIGHTLLGTTYMYSEAVGIEIKRDGGFIINGVYIVGRHNIAFRKEYDKKRDELMSKKPLMQCLLQMVAKKAKTM